MAIARWGTPNTESQIDSGVLNSLANGSTSARMGYDNSDDRARFKPGIAIQSGKALEDQSAASPIGAFESALEEIGLS
ncbi:MAG: hypothetical protein FGM23_03600, partial [Alphaproteobacteria bacterium]|nr:hypothetical protein [Alphaproteobacteria bacterium]